MSKVEKGFMYAKTHEWVKFLDDSTALIGLSDHAQHALGDLVFVNLPAEGDAVVCGDPLGDIESVKAVSDIYSYVTGTVAEVNEDVADEPQKINEDPYGAWMVKVTGISAKGELLDAEAYEKFCAEEA